MSREEEFAEPGPESLLNNPEFMAMCEALDAGQWQFSWRLPEAEDGFAFTALHVIGQAEPSFELIQKLWAARPRTPGIIYSAAPESMTLDDDAEEYNAVKVIYEGDLTEDFRQAMYRVAALGAEAFGSTSPQPTTDNE